MLFKLSDHITRKVYINESVGAYTIKDISRVAPYTQTRSCVHIGVLKKKIKSKKKKIDK
jgi:hypothetical protein